MNKNQLLSEKRRSFDFFAVYFKLDSKENRFFLVKIMTNSVNYIHDYAHSFFGKEECISFRSLFYVLTYATKHILLTDRQTEKIVVVR